MPTIPYIKRVAAAALGSIDSVLNHWLPGGKREGHEYLPLNPRRSDSQPGSFSINLTTGAWSDFAMGDKGLDLVSLIAYLENETQGKATNHLAVFLGIEPEESNQPKRTGSDSKPSGNGKHQPARKNRTPPRFRRAVMMAMTAGSVSYRFPMMHQSPRRRIRNTGSRQSVIRIMLRMAV